ncbi:DUF6850 family outer membrane beta-barrel protein [Belliella marina]|uniref:DUF6850 family outer membrane beta-barrel protein n=1 Tax=Belliella marina TaxID=1644146 RepID=A0ABW4VKD4_9BACT
MSKSIVLLVVFCLVQGAAALAQDSIPDRFYREQLALEMQYLHPYMMEASDPRFYEAGIGYHSQDGVRTQPFGPTKSKTLAFDTRSRIQVKEWAIFGKFSYSKVLDERRSFLLQSDRLVGMPYLVMDGLVGSWSGDNTGFLFSIKSPYYGSNDRLSTSMSVSYDVGSTSRGSEPRPLANHNEYKIDIQEAVRFNDIWQAGLGLGYRSGGEELQIGSYSIRDFRLLQARGWYTFTSNTFQSYQRKLFVKETNYLFFLTYQREKIKSFAEFRLENENVEARDGIAFPIVGGNAKAKAMNLMTGIQIHDFYKGRFELYLKYNNKNQLGRDPVFGAINVENGSAEISNEMIWQSIRKNPWQVGSSIDWRSYESTDIAANAGLHLREFNTSLYLLKEIQLSESNKFYLKPSVNLQRGDVSQMGNKATELSNLLIPPMLSFYGQTYWEPGMGMFWEHRLQRKQLLSISISYSNRISETYPLNEILIRTSLIL